MKLTGEFDFATKTRRVRDSQLNLREHSSNPGPSSARTERLHRQPYGYHFDIGTNRKPLHVFPSRLSVFVVNQFLNLFAPFERELRLRLDRFAIHFNDGINHKVDG